MPQNYICCHCGRWLASLLKWEEEGHGLEKTFFDFGKAQKREELAKLLMKALYLGSSDAQGRSEGALKGQRCQDCKLYATLAEKLCIETRTEGRGVCSQNCRDKHTMEEFFSRTKVEKASVQRC